MRIVDSLIISILKDPGENGEVEEVHEILVILLIYHLVVMDELLQEDVSIVSINRVNQDHEVKIRAKGVQD